MYCTNCLSPVENYFRFTDAEAFHTFKSTTDIYPEVLKDNQE